MAKLDLKYRPKTFSDVLGNTNVKKLLLTRSRNKTLNHQSMMLSGPKGCGKTTLARIISKAISCANLQDGEPCNECGPCISVMNENSLSFEEMDAASQGTVEKIREMIKDSDYETLDGMNQVYIVDEAQRLSAAAQEAFLKAIESRKFTVILCTTDPQKVKGPIRSRVEEYPIYAPSDAEILERLKFIANEESISYEESGLKLIPTVKENCPRECIIALDTISQLGPITESLVKSHFRYSSYILISELLSTLNDDPKKTINLLDELIDKETPTWVRDNIVKAISSAIRVGIGAKPTFLVKTDFFKVKGRAWGDLASELIQIEKINKYDLESILLKNSQAIPAVQMVESIIKVEEPVKKTEEPAKPEEPVKRVDTNIVKNPPPTEPPKKLEEPKKEKIKEVTVDGINFSSDEMLTSLDKKLEKPRPESEKNRSTVLQVELNLDHVPITEKNFSDSLLTRLKG